MSDDKKIFAKEKILFKHGHNLFNRIIKDENVLKKYPQLKYYQKAVYYRWIFLSIFNDWYIKNIKNSNTKQKQGALYNKAIAILEEVLDPKSYITLFSQNKSKFRRIIQK